jgi:hypothetical protein
MILHCRFGYFVLASQRCLVNSTMRINVIKHMRLLDLGRSFKRGNKSYTHDCIFIFHDLYFYCVYEGNKWWIYVNLCESSAKQNKKNLSVYDMVYKILMLQFPLLCSFQARYLECLLQSTCLNSNLLFWPRASCMPYCGIMHKQEETLDYRGRNWLKNFKLNFSENQIDQ